MRFNARTVYLAAALLASSTVIASAQNATDSKGNAVGSEHVGSGGGTTTGTMHERSPATTGMSSGPERGSPNGSPSAPPKATTGPQGDPSKTESGPR